MKKNTITKDIYFFQSHCRLMTERQNSNLIQFSSLKNMSFTPYFKFFIFFNPIQLIRNYLTEQKVCISDVASYGRAMERKKTFLACNVFLQEHSIDGYEV